VGQLGEELLAVLIVSSWASAVAAMIASIAPAQGR
jgi:hypothetical protein